MIDYNYKCMFFNSFDRSCDILTSCVCKNCKFAKTEKEFYAAQTKAETKLEEKGLKPVKKRIDGEQVMSTEKAEELQW